MHLHFGSPVKQPREDPHRYNKRFFMITLEKVFSLEARETRELIRVMIQFSSENLRTRESMV